MAVVSCNGLPARRTHASSSAALLSLIAVGVVLQLVAAMSGVAEAADKGSFVLERKVSGPSDEGQWVPAASFTVTRYDVASIPKMKVQSATSEALSKAEKTALTTAKHIFYRVRSDESGENPGKVHAMITLSPCSLIRGFEAKDSKTLQLTETFKVSIGSKMDENRDDAESAPSSIVVTGLQVSSTTNVFHAKMTKGDECDRSILTLFPDTLLKTDVSLLRHTTIRAHPDYRELKILAPRAGGIFSGENAPEEAERDEPAKEGSKNEKPKEDNRTFFEKYGTVIIFSIAFTVLRGFIGGKTSAAKGNAAPAATAAASN